MADSFAEIEARMRGLRDDVKQLKRGTSQLIGDTTWLIQAMQALLDHYGIVHDAPPTTDQTL
jgi:hypothetical protein